MNLLWCFYPQTLLCFKESFGQTKFLACNKSDEREYRLLNFQSSPCHEIMHEAQKLFQNQTLSLCVIDAKPEPFGIFSTHQHCGRRLQILPQNSDKPDY